MTPRQIRELLPLMQGLVALKGLMTDESVGAAMQAFTDEQGKLRQATSAAAQATRDKESAIRKFEDAERKSLEAVRKLDASTAKKQEKLDELKAAEDAFDKHAAAETARLTEWESRLKAAPEDLDKIAADKAKAAEERARQKQLRERLEARLEELGVREVA